MVQPHFRDESLEAWTALRTGAGASEVIVNDDDALPWPPQGESALHQPVLESGGLLVPRQLLGGRLPDIHHGQPLQMAWRYLRGRGPFRLRRKLAALRAHLPPPFLLALA